MLVKMLGWSSVSVWVLLLISSCSIDVVMSTDLQVVSVQTAGRSSGNDSVQGKENTSAIFGEGGDRVDVA